MFPEIPTCNLGNHDRTHVLQQLLHTTGVVRSQYASLKLRVVLPHANRSVYCVFFAALFWNPTPWMYTNEPPR
jgi:hypothetical protein